MASDTPLTTHAARKIRWTFFVTVPSATFWKVGRWHLANALGSCCVWCPSAGRPSVQCEESLARLQGRRVARGPWSSEVTGHKT